MGISTVIITYNESKNMAKCINSVLSFSDEIIVLDSFSEDDTTDIIASYGHIKLFQRKFDNYINQKNMANSYATQSHIFSIDADEWCSDSLIDYLKTNASNLPALVQFRRMNNYLGQWIRYGSWVPDTKLRLWKKDLAQWGGTMPHETLVFDPNIEITKNNHPIYHNAYSSFGDHIYKASKYAHIAASNHLQDTSKMYLILKMCTSPVVKLFKGIIIKNGLFNGPKGWILELILCWETFYKYWLALFLAKKNSIDTWKK